MHKGCLLRDGWARLWAVHVGCMTCDGRAGQWLEWEVHTSGTVGVNSGCEQWVCTVGVNSGCEQWKLAVVREVHSAVGGHVTVGSGKGTKRMHQVDQYMRSESLSPIEERLHCPRTVTFDSPNSLV
eukprot:6027277-Pyramimonas_sp.AAC.2